MTAAVEVRGVSKQYRRGVQHHGLLSTAVWRWARGAAGQVTGRGRQVEDEWFWALKDVSFSIEPGQVVGIIGRNGSGKSTLLKIVSQITAPTAGEVRLKGRTGTLLEVGTGFHPELSGRDNVFLNGAILGMSRAEIARKFDEIVAFSGVEAFIDTAVKRYSSGMQTRLAFSVAAHLEPEILIVDEVLAVGDAEFQKKCLGKMNEVSKEGRTVLFVSHNMNAVDQLCDRVIWLDSGEVRADTIDTFAATSKYLFGGDEQSITGELRASDAPPLDNEFFTFQSFRIVGASGEVVRSPVPGNTDLSVEISLILKDLHPALSIGYAAYNESGEVVYWTLFTDETESRINDLRLGSCVLRCPIPRRFLNQGLYRLDLMTSLHHMKWITKPGESPYAIFLRIQGGLSDSAYWQQHRPGIVAPVLPWSVTPLEVALDGVSEMHKGERQPQP